MKTRAYIIKKDGTKFWFDIPTETAQKVLRLQKMFKEERQKKRAVEITLTVRKNTRKKGVPPSIVSKKARQTAKHLFLIYCLQKA
jgi:hypothetical protein